jgi:hypothetical protein
MGWDINFHALAVEFGLMRRAPQLATAPVRQK